MPYISIINGPNLNLLGRRRPDIYGTATAEDIAASLSTGASGVEIRMVCLNGEGELIDRLQADGLAPDCLGIVLNAGAYTHTSLAIADAIEAIERPVVEVHLSNIFAREEIRHRSLIAARCRGSISGFGALGYQLAVDALLADYEHRK